jgi:hypothetical protein
MSGWRRQQELQEYRDSGLPAFEEFLAEWKQDNQEAMERHNAPKDTKEDN